MSTSHRILLALVIVLVDVGLFVLPLTGFFAAYVLLARPPWFRAFVDDLYDTSR